MHEVMVSIRQLMHMGQWKKSNLSSEVVKYSVVNIGPRPGCVVCQESEYL